jgi:hypothetical protein
MTFTAVLIPLENQFSATLAGEPEIRAFGDTRQAAVEALKAEVSQRIERGELISLDVDAIGVSALAGKYRDDPTLEQICAQAYRERDAESKQ